MMRSVAMRSWLAFQNLVDFTQEVADISTAINDRQHRIESRGTIGVGNEFPAGSAVDDGVPPIPCRRKVAEHGCLLGFELLAVLLQVVLKGRIVTAHFLFRA